MATSVAKTNGSSKSERKSTKWEERETRRLKQNVFDHLAYYIQVQLPEKKYVNRTYLSARYPDAIDTHLRSSVNSKKYEKRKHDKEARRTHHRISQYAGKNEKQSTSNTLHRPTTSSENSSSEGDVDRLENTPKSAQARPASSLPQPRLVRRPQSSNSIYRTLTASPYAVEPMRKNIGKSKTVGSMRKEAERVAAHTSQLLTKLPLREVVGIQRYKSFSKTQLRCSSSLSEHPNGMLASDKAVTFATKRNERESARKYMTEKKRVERTKQREERKKLTSSQSYMRRYTKPSTPITTYEYEESANSNTSLSSISSTSTSIHQTSSSSSDSEEVKHRRSFDVEISRITKGNGDKRTRGKTSNVTLPKISTKPKLSSQKEFSNSGASSSEKSKKSSSRKHSTSTSENSYKPYDNHEHRSTKSSNYTFLSSLEKGSETSSQSSKSSTSTRRSNSRGNDEFMSRKDSEINNNASQTSLQSKSSRSDDTDFTASFVVGDKRGLNSKPNDKTKSLKSTENSSGTSSSDHDYKDQNLASPSTSSMSSDTSDASVTTIVDNKTKKRTVNITSYEVWEEKSGSMIENQKRMVESTEKQILAESEDIESDGDSFVEKPVNTRANSTSSSSETPSDENTDAELSMKNGYLRNSDDEPSEGRVVSTTKIRISPATSSDENNDEETPNSKSLVTIYTSEKEPTLNNIDNTDYIPVIVEADSTPSSSFSTPSDPNKKKIMSDDRPNASMETNGITKTKPPSNDISLTSTIPTPTVETHNNTEHSSFLTSSDKATFEENILDKTHITPTISEPKPNNDIAAEKDSKIILTNDSHDDDSDAKKHSSSSSSSSSDSDSYSNSSMTSSLRRLIEESRLSTSDLASQTDTDID